MARKWCGMPLRISSWRTVRGGAEGHTASAMQEEQLRLDPGWIRSQSGLPRAAQRGLGDGACPHLPGGPESLAKPPHGTECHSALACHGAHR